MGGSCALLDRDVCLPLLPPIYDLQFSTYTHVPGSGSIHILHIVVLDYGELLAYWFILHGAAAEGSCGMLDRDVYPYFHLYL
jgi:hypothetical protein